ncbi:MAG: 16S rRNA processing protein RimM [Gammaproteobacteria bacterium]|nr:16S rRNA processing protein RimM [Gammaproteobacteria bacterium]
MLKKHLLKKHQPKKLLLRKLLLRKHLLKKLNQKKRKISNINNIPVAKFGKTHGLKGEIKVISYCDPLENILTFSNFFLEDKSPLKIRFVSTSKSFIAKIESIDSIEDAKAFVNKEIFVPIEEIRQDDDAIYWNDLIGCDVIDQNSKLLGKIYKLENHGASDLIFIKTNQEDIIIPLEDQFLGKFDIEANVLNVNWE